MPHLKRVGVSFLALTVVTQISAAAIAQPPASQPVPSGLIAIIKDVPQDATLDLRALSNPYVTGVGLQIRWSDLEPAEGKPNWSKLDALFAAAQSSKKWVQLFIFPGFFTPPWALKDVQTDSFAIQYGPGKGTVMSLPMPWDSTYLNRWFAFLKLLGDRYGSSPAFREIAAAGPTSVSEEMTLPQSPQDLAKWKSDGYTPSKYIAAWGSTLPVFAADFPHQYVSLVVGEPLNINDRGKSKSGEGIATRQTILDQAMSLLGPRFCLENHDLHGDPTTQHADTSFVMGYSGRVITGLEMRCAASVGTCSSAMGATGNPPLALKMSIAKGMAPNGAGQHIDYLEIYEPDVLASSMQATLRYGASLFAH